MSKKQRQGNGKMCKEDIALKQFKEQIEDLLIPEHDDYYLKKWLKARNWNVNKAEEMYRNSMAYREKMGVKTLMKDYTPPEVLQKYQTGGYCGEDRDGAQARVERFGYLDMKGLMYSARRSDLEKTKLLQCETTVRFCEEQSKKLGRRVDGITVIFDMENVGTRFLWRPGLQMYLHLVKVLEDNYPEMMKKLLVINAPMIFPLLYKLCRPLISEEMRNKIIVDGADYRNTLLKYIDEDNLPACYGGKLTDPDGNPNCATMICQGGDVPESYYLKDNDLSENMERITVPKSDKCMIEYEVERPGSLLRWEFKTDDYDIGFGIFKKNGVGELDVILPMQRVNSHIVTEDGTVTCNESGTYVVCFDNSFSWIRDKKIRYHAEVMFNEVDNDVRPEIERFIAEQDWETLMNKFQTTKL